MHRNNFDFVRLVLATFVIFAHSYPLSGNGPCDWLCNTTGGQVSFSYFGVKGFFAISGYLVFQSLIRSSALVDYFWKRCLRIVPALLIVLLLTVILGPLFYYNSLRNYWHNPQVWTYLPRNLFLVKMQFGIKGYFAANPIPGVPNGSLWTIPFEVAMYVLLAFLFFFKRRIITLRLLLSGIFAILYSYNISGFADSFGGSHPTMQQMLELGTYFTAGALLASLNFGSFKGLSWITCATVLLIALSLAFRFFGPVRSLLIPLAVISAGLQSTPVISRLGIVVGDLSYGVYIYAYPVQQALVCFFGLQPLMLTCCTVLITYMLAAMSWHLVEKKALKWKRYSPVSLLIHRK